MPSDATSVVVNVVALNATADGYLSTYDTDNGDPNVATVGVKDGINSNQTDTIPVSSTGTVSVANHTSAGLDVVITLMGYYTGDSDNTTGDTYSDAPWIKIVDTTTGLGAPEVQVPARGSLTVQVGGQGGIATGADTAVVQLSAKNATQNGYLTAYPAGTTDPNVSLLIYDGVMTYRDLAYVPLSSSGQMTITNHGTQPVDVEVVTRGYFMPPSATPVGAEYAPVASNGPVNVYGSSAGGAQIAANASVTFQVAGAAGLPATGVIEVAEHVVVTNPTKSGFLDVYRGGGADPNNATTNFVANDNTDVGYQDSILSSISPTGEETISNHSSGTVDVQVAVVGVFFAPQVPPAPSYLQTSATYSGEPRPVRNRPELDRRRPDWRDLPFRLPRQSDRRITHRDRHDAQRRAGHLDRHLRDADRRLHLSVVHGDVRPGSLFRAERDPGVHGQHGERSRAPDSDGLRHAHGYRHERYNRNHRRGGVLRLGLPDFRRPGAEGRIRRGVQLGVRPEGRSVDDPGRLHDRERHSATRRVRLPGGHGLCVVRN